MEPVQRGYGAGVIADVAPDGVVEPVQPVVPLPTEGAELVVVEARGVQAAFFEIKSSLKPNHVVKKISSQASNQIAVPKNCQIKPQIKSGSSNFHQIKSQIKPPAYEFSQIKSQIKSQPQNFRQIKSQIT